MSGWASSSRSANSNADRFIAAGLAPAATHAVFVPPSASVLPRDSVPEGVSDANPARNSRLEVPRSAGAAERRDVGGTPQGSPYDVMRPSLAARPRQRKEGGLSS